jgi:hypothetical protein
MFRFGAFFLAIVLLGPGCTNCTFEAHGPGLWANRAEITSGIKRQMATLELEPQEVRCPGAGEKIHTTSTDFTCTAIVDGVEVPYTVTIDVLHSKADGKFVRTPVRTSRLERVLAEQQKQPGGLPVVTCPGPAIRFSDPAQDFECEVVLGAQRAQMVVHWENTDGRYVTRPMAPADGGTPLP